MAFLSSILRPLSGVFGRAYDSAETTGERKEPSFVVADARDELSQSDRMKLISRTRHLVRNHGFAREQVASMEMYSVGDGITPQATTDSAEWNAAAEEFFKDFSRAPETSGRFTFGKLTRLVCRALDTDGEIFAVHTAENGAAFPKLQMIEAHRCAGKFDAAERIFDGIRFDACGAPAGYFFTDDTGEEREIEARFVTHVFIAERATDAHGVPQLQHATNTLIDARELFAIEKKGVKTINEMTFAIESERNANDDTRSGDFVFGGGGGDEGTDPDAFKRQIGGGKFGKLLPGERLHEIAANRPSPTFQGFLDYLFKDASLGNVPYEFVSDSSKIGGAGVRLIVGRASRVFSRRQQELIEMFLEPVWRYVIGWAIANGKLPAQPGWDRAEWACPKSVTVDAGREAANDRADVAAGLISSRDLFAQRGMRFDVELRQIAKEKALQAALEKEYGLAPGTLSGQRKTDNG